MPKTRRAPAARARQRGFFDFSISELAIIFGVALVVLGPKKLPGLVKQIGRMVGRARHMARQFREQLEAEVNSIDAVKPVPRHVPDVGPTAPNTDVPPPTHSGVTDTLTPEESAAANAASTPTPVTPPVTPEPMPEQMHPEAQIYFALNGTEPTLVARDPYESQALAEDAHAAAPGSAEGGPAPAPVQKVEEPQQPASVEVVFPHDHG